jgi:threonine/homoserine/homoserine lactone efflux protein
MQLDVYIAFFIATTIMILIPGPSVLLTVAHSLAYGWRQALLTVAGATCGVGIQVTATFVGMASFMLLLAEGFEWLRWAGVAYLLYLGLKQWRARPEDANELAAASPRGRGRSLFLQGLVVTIPNPKSLLFLAAFFPQFVDPAVPLATQAAIMLPSFLFITFVFTAVWALGAGQLRGLFQSRKRIVLRNRITGGLMIAAAAGLAAARR